MPKFEKSTGYKMKGSKFYGKGSSSPAKVSDADVVKAQKELDKIEIGYRQPGWAKAAKKVFTGSGQLEGVSGGGGAGEGGGGGAADTVDKADNVISSVADIVKKNELTPD